MSNILKISDALQFYFASDVNAHAVQDMISVNNNWKSAKRAAYTSGMTWEEIHTQNAARLAAMKVQVDYWELLYQAWEKTWGEALSLLDSQLQEVDASDYDNERSMECVWDDGVLYKKFQLREGVLSLSTYTGEKGSLALSFYFEDSSDRGYELSNQIKLSDGWMADPENDERVTKSGLLPIANQAEIDVSMLERLAKEAFKKLMMQVGKGNLLI